MFRAVSSVAACRTYVDGVVVQLSYRRGLPGAYFPAAIVAINRPRVEWEDTERCTGSVWIRRYDISVFARGGCHKLGATCGNDIAVGRSMCFADARLA